jgi:hypothetical protein
MSILVVAGSGRGAGKTALACGLIAALPDFRWTAVKITTHDHGQTKPIWEETEPASVQGQGTDTARYLAAGAHRALLATPPLLDDSPVSDFSSLLSLLWPLLGPGANVLFESNSILNSIHPDLCLAVGSDPERESANAQRKPSFIPALRHADALVAHADDDRMFQEGEESKPIFHLADLERLSPQMLAWVRLRLRPAPHS